MWLCFVEKMPLRIKRVYINTCVFFLKRKIVLAPMEVFYCVGIGESLFSSRLIRSINSLWWNSGNLKSCIRHLPIRFSELANTPHSPQANALVGQWQGQCIRLWRMHRRRLGFAISLKRMANEICLYNSLLIGSVCAPLRGEGRGRKEKGGGRKGPALGGPCAQRIPSPPSSPPLGPRNPTGNPSLCFFSSSSFYFFGSTCHQLRLLSFHFLLSTFSHVSLSLNVLLLPEVSKLLVSARIFKMLHHLR